MEIKKLCKYILFIALIISIFYGFIWIHEMGHVITVFLVGGEVERIEVGILGGACYTNYTGNSIEWYWLICVMGSVSTLLIAVPLFIHSIWKKKIIVSTLMFIQIEKELLYWGISPYINCGDAYNVIMWYDSIDQNLIVEIVYNVSIVCLVLLVLLYVLWIYFLIKKV